MTFRESVGQDIRQALRSLHRSPAFTATALLILTLGIGANIAIFTILNGVLLRPLPYSRPAQLMFLTTGSGTTEGALSVPEYLEFRQMTRTFADVGAYRQVGGVYTTGEINITTGDRPQRARSLSVDTHLLAVLGLHAIRGRTFEEQETSLTADRGLESPQAMLSYEFWQSAFNGESIVGKTVRIDGRPFEIVGIMEPGGDVMDNRTQVWLPLGLPRAITAGRTFHIVNVVGRLKDGITAEAARAELNAFLANWGERTGTGPHVPVVRPTGARQHTLRLDPLQDVIVAGARRPLWLLQIAVALVLLVASINLANLVLARSEVRRHEFAIRAALGASRARMLRHAISEGLVLSLAGGALGLGVAQMLVKALVSAYPSAVPRTTGFTIDAAVVLFTAGTSVVAAILLGIAPATQRRIVDLLRLREAGMTGGGGRHRARRRLRAAARQAAIRARDRGGDDCVRAAAASHASCRADGIRGAHGYRRYRSRDDRLLPTRDGRLFQDARNSDRRGPRLPARGPSGTPARRGRE